MQIGGLMINYQVLSIVLIGFVAFCLIGVVFATIYDTWKKYECMYWDLAKQCSRMYLRGLAENRRLCGLVDMERSRLSNHIEVDHSVIDRRIDNAIGHWEKQ